jgi:hypothetical protein
LRSAKGWDEAHRDAQALVALLGEYGADLDLDNLSKDEGLRVILDRMSPEVRARAEGLLAVQDAYDVARRAEEEP